MIAVHCGAGQYNSGTIKEYKVLSKRACKKSIAILDKGGTAIHACWRTTHLQMQVLVQILH